MIRKALAKCAMHLQGDSFLQYLAIQTPHAEQQSYRK